MASPTQIRPATPSDAETIADYNRRLAWETESLELDPATIREGVRAVLSDPSKGRYLVAETDGRIVGQLMLTFEWSDWKNGMRWWIQSVYVHADYRRRGIFRALYERVLEDARRENVCAIRLYVEHANNAAQRTYKELGLYPAGYLVFEQEL